MRRVGRGPPALAPVPVRFERPVRGVAAFVPALAMVALDCFGFAVFAFASATTAFVSGDVARVAAFANVLSPAAVVRLTDHDQRRTAGEFVSDRVGQTATLSIRSTKSARQAGASNGFAKYSVIFATLSPRISPIPT